MRVVQTANVHIYQRAVRGGSVDLMKREMIKLKRSVVPNLLKIIS
jgi:hypothetical protein